MININILVLISDNVIFIGELHKAGEAKRQTNYKYK